MPTPLLNAYAEQMAPLIAEESLLTADRVAVGTNTLKKGMRQRIVSGWLRTTGQRRSAMRPSSKAMYDAQMSGMGIGVKLVTKAPPDGPPDG